MMSEVPSETQDENKIRVVAESEIEDDLDAETGTPKKERLHASLDKRVDTTALNGLRGCVSFSNAD